MHIDIDVRCSVCGASLDEKDYSVNQSGDIIISVPPCADCLSAQEEELRKQYEE